MKQTIKLLSISVVALGILAFVKTPTAHAATIPVASGNDETTANSTCSLSEAITNVNNGDATSYPECDSTNADPFGTNDTIQLPTGTITLTADLPAITESITIQGEGMGESVVDGDSDFKVFEIGTGATGSATANGFTVQAYRGLGLATDAGDIDFGEIEVDGTNAVSGPTNMGFGFFTTSAANYVVTVHDVYVHDITDLAFNTNVMGIWAVVGYNANVALDIQNVTVSNIAATSPNTTAMGIGILNGVFQGGASGQVTFDINNATITGISSTSGNAGGILTTTFNDDSDSAVQTAGRVRNSTIVNITAPGTAMITGSVGGAVVAAAPGGVTVGATFDLVNNILEDPCVLVDLSSLITSVTDGIMVNTITSGGGNLSGNSTCASYLTHPTDRNNVAALADTLLPLAFNGGYVPTMALKQGSPAIDAGITVAGLTTDARGVVRPQGLAYDAGAYESPYTKTSAGGELAGTGERVWLVSGAAALLVIAGSGAILKTRKATF